tara:strand:+ start:2503 stop:2958 length:456 start_codon:yes stop_codon:yes gene_type:complete
MYKNKDKKGMSKFEFILKIKGNIICQRYFNVRDYNPKSVESVEFIDEFNSVRDKVLGYLKERSLDYLCDKYNTYSNTVYLSQQDLEGSEKEIFEIEVKENGKNLMSTYLPSNIYPTRVRYTVDIRPMIPSILNGLTDIMSLRKVTSIDVLR